MAYNEALENQKYEIIDSEEVMLAQPSVNHITIAGNLNRIIGNYLRGKRCMVFSEMMVYLDENNHYIPDVIIVCDHNKIKTNYIEGSPDLAIEILSNSTKKMDISIKKDAYEHFGVKEYWIVSPKEKSIEVYLLKDGKYKIDDVYSVMEDWELESLTEEQKADHKLTLKVSLYDDLEIDINEIFEKLI